MPDLQTVVQRMIDAGEPEQNIAAVIQQFKSQPQGPQTETVRSRTGQMYSRPVKGSALDEQTVASDRSDFLGGAKDALEAPFKMAYGLYKDPVGTIKNTVASIPASLGMLVTNPARFGGSVAGGAAYGAAAPEAGPGLSKVGQAAERFGTFAEPKANAIALGEALRGNLPAAAGVSLAPRAISAIGRGAQRVGQLLTKPSEADAITAQVDRYLPNSGGAVPTPPRGPVAAAATEAAPIPRLPGTPLGGESITNGTIPAQGVRDAFLRRLSEQENLAHNVSFGEGAVIPNGMRPSESLGPELGAALDEDRIGNQAAAQAQQGGATPRPAKVPLKGNVPASKSRRTPMSATPGLTTIDVEELGLNPALPIKELTPELIDRIKANRASRSSLYRATAEMDKLQPQ